MFPNERGRKRRRRTTTMMMMTMMTRRRRRRRRMSRFQIILPAGTPLAKAAADFLQDAEHGAQNTSPSLNKKTKLRTRVTKPL